MRDDLNETMKMRISKKLDDKITDVVRTINTTTPHANVNKSSLTRHATNLYCDSIINDTTLIQLPNKVRSENRELYVEILKKLKKLSILENDLESINEINLLIDKNE